MATLHVTTKIKRRHCYPTLRSTYLGSLTLPEGYPFTRISPLVSRRYLLYPYEPWCVCYCFGIAQVCLEPHSIENPYHLCQYYLHSEQVSTCYQPVIFIEAYVVLAFRPKNTVLCLLGST